MTDGTEIPGIPAGVPYLEDVRATAQQYPGPAGLLFTGGMYAEATGAGNLFVSSGGTFAGNLSGDPPGCFDRNTNQFNPFKYPVRVTWTMSGTTDAASYTAFFSGSVSEPFSFQQYWVEDDPLMQIVFADVCVAPFLVVAGGFGVAGVTGGIADFSRTFGMQLLLPQGVTFTDQNGQMITAPPVAEPVPEPASLALLGLGLAAVGASRWRQRNR